MSERILKALMQLFAIIARPESDIIERLAVVKSFLEQQLNQELVRAYLEVFKEYLDIYQKRRKRSSKRKKQLLSFNAVRVLKICTEINEELSQKQKYVLTILLLEFIKSDSNDDGEISEQEIEFVDMVADTFYIPLEEFKKIKSFILNAFTDSDFFNKDVLVIDDRKTTKNKEIKHICAEALNGQICILHMTLSNMYIMRYFGESELYLSSQLVRQDKIYILTSGTSIRNSIIKSIYFSDIVSTFSADQTQTKIIFDVKNIEYQFKNGKVGLYPLNFSEESGKLIGIMGASGAGKSTLLNVLNGTYKPSKGEILINGINIHENKSNTDGLIGYVSQDDLLMEDLTVFENLYYNAKLCFANYSQQRVIRTVLKLLQTLGLYEIRKMTVGSPLNKKISGGQRKRLNIALELLREPSILFLDEPTSGLSSRDSENILDLLKELALKGKLVFVVIHQPSSDIFKMFDKLLILDTGGYLIFKGDPIDSIMYFKSRVHQADWNESVCHVCGNINVEQVFNIVESQVLDEYGNLTKTRKISPKEWYNFFEDYNDNDNDNKKKIKPSKKLPDISFKIPNKIQQFFVFVKRDMLSKMSNTQYLVINLLESLLLAFLLSFIIKYYNVDEENNLGYIFSENSNLPVYIFMSVIVALFIGLTVSAEEIIKDRKILKREVFLNLSRRSYLFSKIAILFSLSAFQALTFVLMGNFVMEIKAMYFEYWLVLFSTWAVANMLGLNISDAFKTPVTIYILIPFLIIPQIILSGIIVNFDKLNPTISSPNSIPIYGEVMFSRWAYEALSVKQFKDNEYEKQFFWLDKKMSNAEFKKNYWLRNLENKLQNCKRHLNDSLKRTKIESDLLVLRNEIEKEFIKQPKLTFKSVNKLTIDKFDNEVFTSTKKYFGILRKYYTKLYNKANTAKDKLITSSQNNKEKREIFIQRKKDYHNESLSDLVCNVNAVDRVIEYDGYLYQKNNPVFNDPESKFLKAHFYAPRKRFFNTYIDTFWVNIIVLWLIVIIFYFTLYFKLLKRSLDFFEELTDKYKKKIKA